ncbi:hypothetical protein AB1Y20_012781 [Prymnesium parvum]|uniref:Uncharacterized protein n=1 Tax=Prymnesium parvum TaxID=97485 RepID=A0AB34IJT5_PRYPA
MFGVPPIARVGSDLITPVGSSIIIKLLADLQTQLVAAVDETVARVGVASPKTPPTPEAIEEWRNFPLSMAGYKAQLSRLAAVAASVGCEQAVTELMLRWLPPEMGAMLGGVAFQRSQFEYGKFVERLKCLKLGQSGNDKQQKAMQAEEQRNTELVKSVTAVVVCDVLEAILAPRPNREFIMLDPDIGHVCVQLAFHNYQPVEKQQYNHIHPALAAELHQVVVRRWGHVIAHLARSRFDQITNEFIGRMHAAKGSAEEVLKILVGTQRIAIPHLQAPSVVPFIDQYRQIALSSKKEYSQLQVRLCLIYNIEMVVRQIDCGVGEMELLNLYEKIYAIYPPVSTWAEKPELIMAATQLMTLIISHAPTPFWAAHMDVSKEAKQRSNALLGGKKEGLLRELLTHQAYEEKSARSSLCGVLRLLCGGAPLPHSIIGQPTEVEWWHEKGSSSYEGSLLQHTMRTQENQGGVQGSHVQNPRAERLDFVVEKLFNRKATGRTQRLPYLLENGDVLVYIVGQVAVHSVEVGLKAFEHLLKDPKDLEFNLIGVCSLSRMLKSKELVEVLSPQLKYFADKLMTVVDRCEKEVGYGSSFGEAQVALPFAKMKEDDSVQVMLSRVSKKKDREVAVRLATYREAIACMPLALPEQVVKQPSHFIGQLLVHLDVELATSASRMLQSMMVDQPQYRRDILRCMAKLLCRMLCEPGGKATLRSKEHVAALTGYQNRLLTIVGHITQLLIIWIERLPEEPMALDAYVAEGYVSETVKIEPELIELDAAGFALLGHPSSSLRKEAMKLLSTTKELFYAYKAAYDRAVSDAHALEEFLVGRRSALEGEASRDSIAVVEERRDHVDYIEYFGADVMEMTESAVVRRAIKREMLEEKQGVASELPTELQLAKMQVPEMKKLLSLDAQALAMSSQVTFCLAELVNGLIFCGCARRVTKLRQLLVATLTGTPFAKDIAGLISEGNNDLGVLWRNCNCMLMMLAGACVPSTRPLMHPDAQIKQPPEPLEEPPAFPSQRGSVLLPDEPTSARREASGYDAASGYERGCVARVAATTKAALCVQRGASICTAASSQRIPWHWPTLFCRASASAAHACGCPIWRTTAAFAVGRDASTADALLHARSRWSALAAIFASQFEASIPATFSTVKSGTIQQCWASRCPKDLSLLTQSFPIGCKPGEG